MGVPLSDEARRAVGALVGPLRSDPDAGRARWVREESLHVTLRFLGAVHGDRVPAIESSLRRALASSHRATVTLLGGGAFPSASRPRVLWVAIAAGADGLAELAEGVSRAVEPLGWPPEERRFRPHLTLARTDAVPHRAGSRLATALEDAAASWSTEFPVDRVVLYRSHPGRGGSVYEPLATVPLGPIVTASEVP